MATMVRSNAIWFLAASYLFCMALGDITSDTLKFAETSLSNLSETSIPATGVLGMSYFPYCKVLNSESCGVIVSSIWKWPTCCSSRANFTSSDESSAADCSYIGVPYSPSQWTCNRDSVKACCREVQCKAIRADSVVTKSCPKEKPESSCCDYSDPTDQSEQCEPVANATTATCSDKSLTYLYCCPSGTLEVLEASSNDITTALLGPLGR